MRADCCCVGAVGARVEAMWAQREDGVGVVRGQDLR